MSSTESAGQAVPNREFLRARSTSYTVGHRCDVHWPTGELVTDRVAGVCRIGKRPQNLARATGRPEADWRRVRGPVERAATVQDRDRRAGHPLGPRAVGPHPNALPLIMTHGWPGLRSSSCFRSPSVHSPTRLRTAAVAEDAFHLRAAVDPHGYGVLRPADRARRRGPIRIGRAWDELMQRLELPPGLPSLRGATWAPRSPTPWAAWDSTG